MILLPGQDLLVGWGFTLPLVLREGFTTPALRFMLFRGFERALLRRKVDADGTAGFSGGAWKLSLQLIRGSSRAPLSLNEALHLKQVNCGMSVAIAKT